MHSVSVVPSSAEAHSAAAIQLVLLDDVAPQTAVARIAVTGDFCPIGLHVAAAGTEGYARRGGALEGLKAVAEVSDLTVVNLECPLGRGAPIRKSGPSLVAEAGWASVLREAGVDVVSLANNHILDQGPAGLRATVESCRDAGMDTVGAGTDTQAAARPLVCEVRGVSVALVALAEHEFATATTEACGAAPAEPMAAFRAIRDAGAQADVVIVLLHGGSEHFPLPTPRQRELARFFIEVGAHAVACHHSHIVGPLEWYQGRPIAYGLGNLLFPDGGSAHDSEWFRSCVLVLDVDATGVVAAQVVGMQFDPSVPTVRVLDEDEHQALAQRLSRLQDALANQEEHQLLWMEHLRRHRVDYLSKTLGLSRVERALLRMGMWPSWRMPRTRVPAMLNAVCCESLHEALVSVLEEELSSWSGSRPVDPR